jgi:hypothetical protein
MAEKNTTEIELAGFVLPPGLNHTAIGTATLMPGNRYANGMSTDGIVTRLLLNPTSGIVTIHLETTDKRPVKQRVFIFPTGMMAEEKS